MLDRRQYAVKEHVGLFKLCDTFDIFDGETGEQLGCALEEISTFTKLMRLLVNKKLLPTCINIYEGTKEAPGELQFSIRRGMVFLRPKAEIVMPDGKVVGFLRSKLLSLGITLLVFDNNENQIATVKGDWKGWNFKIIDKSEREIGVVAKKWAGLAKEFFTSADNYAIALNDNVELKPGYVTLLLAAGLAIDSIFKEGNK